MKKGKEKRKREVAERAGVLVAIGRVTVPLPLADHLDSQTRYVSHGILRESSTQCKERFYDD